MLKRTSALYLAVVAVAVLITAVIVVSDSDESDAALISITPNVSSSEYGQNVIFTVYSEAGGEVVIYADAVEFDRTNVAAGGTATFSISSLIVGDHPISVSDPSGFTQITFHVNKMSIIVKADNKGKHFGDPDPKLTYTINKTPLSGDKLVGSLEYIGDEVGDHSIVELAEFHVVNSSSSINPNYVVTFQPGTMTILPTANLKETTDKISAIPNGILTYEDADRVAEAYATYISLPETWREQISDTLRNKLTSSIAQAALINHSSGSATKIDNVPWNVRITLASVNSNDDSYDRFSNELYRQNIVQLFYVMLTDTITGEEYIVPEGTAANITISGARISDEEDFMVMRELDGGTVPVAFSISDNDLSFEAVSSGLYSTVEDAEIRDGADVSSAMVALFLIIGGIVASFLLDRKFRTGP